MPKVHTKRWLVPRSRLVGKRIYDGYETPINCIGGIILGYMVTFYRAPWWVVEQLICVHDDTAERRELLGVVNKKKNRVNEEGSVQVSQEGSGLALSRLRR